MKTNPYFLLIVNAVLALGLTVLSFQYIQSKHCYNFCDPSYLVPCPKGSCYFGDQKAGWPFPVFVDSPGGGSPTGGWGLLGPEDPPGPTIIVDVLFYSILVWVVWYGIQFFRRQAFPVKHFRASLMLNAFLGVCLWVFYLIFTFTMGFQGVGRGYRNSVDVETSKDMTSAMAFEPTVSVPLGEVIDYYGDPDTVWLTSGTGPNGRTTGMLLYWDAVPVYVELPPIAEGTYPVHRKTAIERIIFYDDQDVVALAGQPIGEERTIWTGYGNYQP
ncbi:MAG TPA: hypothetical protein VHO49_19535 [Anaerolineales bacterium]|nr:hypothetical protein [Anaerolineales bacterium]